MLHTCSLNGMNKGKIFGVNQVYSKFLANVPRICEALSGAEGLGER